MPVCMWVVRSDALASNIGVEYIAVVGALCRALSSSWINSLPSLLASVSCLSCGPVYKLPLANARLQFQFVP